MKKSILVIILAISVYTIIVLFSDISSMEGAFSRIKLHWVPLFLSLSMLNYLLRFVKWQYFLRKIEINIPFWESLKVFLAGFSMTVSPGKLGELVKCSLLKDKRKIPVSRTSPVVVAERVTDLISMIFIAVFALLLVEHEGAFIAVILGVVSVSAVMLLLLWERAFLLFVKMLCKYKKFAEKRESLYSFHKTTGALLDVRGLLVSVPLGIISWGTEALVLCLVAKAIGIELAVGIALLAHSAGTIAGAVSMIPGGLGLTEITIGAILIGTGSLSEPDAAVITLVMRFATLWFAVLLGVLFLWRVKRRRLN